MNKKKTPKEQSTGVMVDEIYNEDDLVISDALNFAKDINFSASPYIEKVTEPKQDKVKKLHDGHRGRMYERYLNNGFNGFQEHEVLEMLLYTAYSRTNTNELAHKLINSFGGLEYV